MIFPKHVYALGGARPVGRGAISLKLVARPPAAGSGKAILGPVGSTLLTSAICKTSITLTFGDLTGFVVEYTA